MAVEDMSEDFFLILTDNTKYLIFSFRYKQMAKHP